ncbi:hypothetical protein [Allosphingosinicella sp.]|jgi:hypothetical protein|uniref:hypothetical protein n=1 Tax=Allosphingosinicella sp. TaxID=2823234 RepID=UPI002EE12DB4
MYSAADSRLDLIEDVLPDRPCPSTRWEDFPYSCISHHDEACCEVAREWVMAYDFAQLNGADASSGPRWLRQRYEWGPSPWPIHWCEAVERDTLDCGALGCMARQIFEARGLTSFAAQFVQQYSDEATCQWRGKWDGESSSTHWIDEDVIYHEACALLVGEGEVKLFDPSAGWWINPRQAGGYGGLLAVRIFDGAGKSYRWGERRLIADQWNRIAERA